MRANICPHEAHSLPRFRHVRQYNDLATRSRLGVLAEIVRAEGFYWLRKADQYEGPYCPDCYERDDITMRLRFLGVLRICPRCGREYARGESY